MIPSFPTLKSIDRQITSQRLVWRGISLAVSYEADWLRLGRGNTAHAVAHLEIQSPGRLPITETGYLSHFIAPNLIEAAGGPAAYVQVLLGEAANSPWWRGIEERKRQLDLFG